MLRKLLLPVLVLLATIKLSAQAPVYQWVQTLGYTDYEVTAAIINDTQGNTYLAGWFNDSIVIGNVILNNPPFKTAGILVKLNASGLHLQGYIC